MLLFFSRLITLQAPLKMAYAAREDSPWHIFVQPQHRAVLDLSLGQMKLFCVRGGKTSKLVLLAVMMFEEGRRKGHPKPCTARPGKELGKRMTARRRRTTTTMRVATKEKTRLLFYNSVFP